jgi:ParB family transcriptional regulator, chromosome partitioning protein
MIAETVAMSKPQQLQDLSVYLIEPNLEQPRQYFDEQALEALAASVRERGILQPVLVRPLQDGKYQLVAGERRWRAAKLAGLLTIPALVSTYDDLAALEVGLIENMAREDLNPIEEARACVTLVQELGLTYRQLGKRVGRDPATVWGLVQLLDLSEEIIELLERRDLSKTHGLMLLLAKDPGVHLELAREAIEQGWSTQTLKARARESNAAEAAPDSSAPTRGSASPGDSSVHAPGDPMRTEGEDGVNDLISDVARVWGDLLGIEVGVRALGGRQLRVEAVFTSPEAALNVGGDLAEQVARAKKRR